MYCGNCGAEIAKEAYICPKCGTKTNNNGKLVEDKPNMALNIISLLLIPLLGIILYFVWKKDTPKRAKTILLYALIGLGINLAWYFISIFITIITNIN